MLGQGLIAAALLALGQSAICRLAERAIRVVTACYANASGEEKPLLRAPRGSHVLALLGATTAGAALLLHAKPATKVGLLTATMLHAAFLCGCLAFLRRGSNRPIHTFCVLATLFCAGSALAAHGVNLTTLAAANFLTLVVLARDENRARPAA